MRHISHSNSSPCQTSDQGFTLVELIVIAPILILVIGSIMATVISLTRASMISQGRAQIQYDVQFALDAIERDLLNSTVIDTTSSSRLLLTNIATDKGPSDSARKPIGLSTCNAATGQLALDQVLTYTNDYVASSAGLVKKNLLNGCTGSGSSIWQKHNSEVSLVKDAIVQMDITYDLNSATPPKARASRVSITATRKIAGRDISYTGTIYAKSVNIN